MGKNNLDIGFIVGLSPKEAVAYLQKHGVKVPRAWEEIYELAKSHAATVAERFRTDVIEATQNLIRESLDRGVSWQDFLEESEHRFVDLGIWSEKPGDATRQEPTFAPWRLKLIYETNVASAYAAAHYQAQMSVKKQFPYWRYKTMDDGLVRASHKALHNRVFRADDPIWDEIYPPNGFNCRCWVEELTEEEVASLGVEVEKPEPAGAIVEGAYRGGPAETRTKWRLSDGSTFVVDRGWSKNPGRDPLDYFTPTAGDEDDANSESLLGKSLSKQPRTINAMKFDPTRLLDKVADENAEKNARKYVNVFLAEFGSKGEPITFTDKTGATLVISEKLFRRPDNRWKIEGRGAYVRMLADTIKHPAEIWLDIEVYRKTGKIRVQRRYLGVYDVGGKKIGTIAIFDKDNAWMGTTSFPIGGESYFNKKRRGILLYERSK